MQLTNLQGKVGRIFPAAFIAMSIATSLLLTGCDTGESQQAPQMPPPGVSFIQVSDQQVGEYQEFVARTEAVDTVQLRARVEGFLTKREFTEGQPVNKGQALFEIDRQPYEAAVKQAEATLSSSKANLLQVSRDLKRSKDLFNKGHLSQSSYDAQMTAEAQAKASVKAAEAGLDTARLNLGYTSITAPFKGRVGKARYSVGNLIGPTSEPLATLTSVDPMYVNFQVDERQLINHLQKNGNRDDNGFQFNLTLRLPNGQNYDRAGTFNFADTAVDETTGTLTLRAAFPNPDGILFPGLYVTLVSESKRTQALPVIPQSAVQENQSGRFVLVINADNQAETRQITTGRRINAMWAVQSGLKAGEKIIVEGLQKVRPGVTVSPTLVNVDPLTGTFQAAAQEQGEGL